MVQFFYIDETGSTGKGAKNQPLLTLVGVLVPEEKVRSLASRLLEVAIKHLGEEPDNFEFHGYEIWSGIGPWADLGPGERLAAYEEAIGLLAELELTLAHSSIDKDRLRERNGEAYLANSYLLALQFLLEKIDHGTEYKVLVADEAKEHELRAVRMVSELQRWDFGGVVSGRTLKTVIDSLHFVRSHDSAGVQMADLAAFVLQRSSRPPERHPDAQAARQRLAGIVGERTSTWREPWPRA